MTLLLDADVPRELRQLLDGGLHLRQPTLERAHFRRERAPRLVQLLHLVRHLLELIEARVVEFAVDGDGLELIVEVLEHSAIVLVERTRADRTRAFLAEIHDAVALQFELGVLPTQRIAFRLRFLAVAHPLRAPRLQSAETLLELLALRFDGDGGFLLHHRRVEDARPPLAEPRELVIQQALGLDERLSTAFLAREPLVPLELLGNL